MFEPAFPMFTDFPLPEQLPCGETTTRVTVTPPPGPTGPSPPIPGPPIWAFVTVTNNETQQITTNSPD